MILRRDHIAGGIFVVAGTLVYALSGDLPWGSLAMPGAGMMPKLAIGLMIVFGLVLIARAGESPPFAEIEWGDLRHAASIVAIAALAVTFFTWLRFVITTAAKMFILLLALEAKAPPRAAALRPRHHR